MKHGVKANKSVVLTSGTWIPSWCPESHCRLVADCQTAVLLDQDKIGHPPPLASGTVAAALELNVPLR